MFKYAIEGSVIIVGILLSFYIEEVRTVNKNIEIKNELLGDLNRALERDLDQINEIQKMLNDSMQRISDLRNDINNNHDQLSDVDTVKKILNANVSTTFFSEDGVFTELVSSGSYELIRNKELKNNPTLPILSVLASWLSIKFNFFLSSIALCLKNNEGISIANSCGGTYGQLTIKHISHNVQESITSSKDFDSTVSNSIESDSSIKSKSLGKLSHKLKHLLQL